jgi:hypothetical protein
MNERNKKEEKKRKVDFDEKGKELKGKTKQHKVIIIITGE